jgi:leader peptidase (prepilin peptidase)/N-methyltransferase
MHLAGLTLVVGGLVFAIVGGWAAAQAAATLAQRPASAALLGVACGLVALLAVTVMPEFSVMAATLFLGWCLILLATVDALVFRLPDIVTLPLIGVGLGFSFWDPREARGSGLLAHGVGAVVGYLALAAVGWCYRKYRGRDGLGLGDAKLLGAAGAWLGWAPLPFVVLIACIGSFMWIGARSLARGREALHERVAFGAPLALAIWIVWLFDPTRFIAGG